MSVAYYIVLDSEDPGFESFVNGKAVAHAVEELDLLADSLGIPHLDDFIGQSMEEFADLLGEDVELADEDDDGESVAEKWFPAQEGVAYFDKLSAALRATPTAVDEAEAVLEDLAEYRAVLTQADQAGMKWHLALDF